MPIYAIGGLGPGELVLVLVIVLLIFGASRLPQIGEGLGKAVRNLKRGLSTDDDIDVTTPEDKQVAARSSAKSASDEVTEAEVVERKS
jgi:sec-independent protein translocase protein TatA